MTCLRVTMGFAMLWGGLMRDACAQGSSHMVFDLSRCVVVLWHISTERGAVTSRAVR